MTDEAGDRRDFNEAVTMPRGKPLPGWPRVLGEAWAAAYIGLSPSAFRRGPMAELPAIKLTAQRKGWLREDLDAWVDRKAGVADAAIESGWDYLG